MTALATRALSPRAQHYAGQLHTLLALKLVEALRTLEAAQEAADAVPADTSGDAYERVHFAVLDTRVEVFRIMDQLGLDARIVGGALA